MPLENLQALEAALSAPEETATETAIPAGTEASSSQEAPASTDTNKPPTIEDANIEDLLRALDSAPSIVAKKETDANETEPPAGGHAAPAPAAPTAAETTDEDDDEDTTGQPAAAQPTAKNFRLHTEDPKLASFLKTLKFAQASNPNVNPAEVAALLGYTMPGQTAAPAAPAAVSSEPPPPDPQMTALQAEIAEIDKQIEHAEDVEYDAKAVRALERTRAEKVWELKQAEETAQAQAIADAEFDAGYTAARAQASVLCPEADEEGTPQFALVFAEVAAIKRSNPTFLDDPSYPVRLLQRVAAKHPAIFPNVVKKAAPSAAPAALAAPAKPVVKPGQPTSRPVGVVVPGANQGPAIDASNAKAAIHNLSAEEAIALADKLGALDRKRKA